MLTPPCSQQIFLATQPVDMRGGFDRLAGRVIQAGLDLYGGDLFVFVSKRRTHLKVLSWDGTGLIVLYKRLSKGRFSMPDLDMNARTACIDAVTFAEILSGCRVEGVRRSFSATRTATAVDTREAM